MGANSSIEWTDHTFNPWRGCQHATLPDGSLHPGCEHCYAEALGKRNPAVLGTWGETGTRVCAAADYWRLPIKWNEEARKAGDRRRVFCASLADVFEDWQGPIIEAEFGRQSKILTGQPNYPLRPATMEDLRARLFTLIDATPGLDWLLLTKRPENVRRMMVPHCLVKVPGHVSQNEGDGFYVKPKNNVWLGTSISDQATADALVPALLKSRDLVPTLFLSVEPLLGPIDFSSYLIPPISSLPFDWVIVGGESGPQARPMHPDWARTLRDQCQAAGVPFFFKQWGEWIEDRDSPSPVPVASTVLAGTPAECTVMLPPKRSLMILRANGVDRVFSSSGKFTGESPQPEDAWMLRVGKKAAGRLLDGRTWDELPAAAAVSQARSEA